MELGKLLILSRERNSLRGRSDHDKIHRYTFLRARPEPDPLYEMTRNMRLFVNVSLYAVLVP